MAARAARYVWGGNGRVLRNGKRFNGRGVQPSSTSLEEGAAAAVSAMFEEWQVLTALWPVQWNDDTIHHLARVGWRAAFRSFGHDMRQGMTGRKADHVSSVQLAPLEAASLEVERVSLAAWAADRQGRIFDPGADDAEAERRERRAVIGWIGSVLDVHAKGRTGEAERARFSVLARLVHGRDIATAARGAGFASGRSALQSFVDGKVWPRLGAAIGARATGREQRLVSARRRAVVAFVRARAEQRAAAAGAGRVDVVGPVALRVIVPMGAAAVVPDGRFRNGRRVIRPAGRRVLPSFHRAGPTGPGQWVQGVGLAGRGAGFTLAAEWARATSARGAAVAQAHSARAALARARADRMADWRAGTKGLRAGWLQTDKAAKASK
jgi:hypothetical protein